MCSSQCINERTYHPNTANLKTKKLRQHARTLNPLSLIKQILTLAVHDNTGAEDSSLLNSHDLQMDKRNIASVAREFFGTYKPR